MIDAADHRKPRARYWVVASASCVLGILVLLPDEGQAYLTAVSIALVLAAVLIAIADARTGLIRNAWTAPLASAAAAHVVIATVTLPRGDEVLEQSALSALLAGGCYLSLGLLGWVGFGDVKFATGIGLVLPLCAGWFGLLLVPLAIVCSGTAAAARRLRRDGGWTSAPHGPAIALAVAGLVLLSPG